MTLELMVIIFFTIAVFYSMAGFGGGSSYIALLAIFSIPYEMIPPIALVCNIIVVSSSSYHHIKNGHMKMNLLLPFVIASIPLAYLCGRITIDKTVLFVVLSLSLLFASIRMLLIKDKKNYAVEKVSTLKLWAGGLSIGALLGGLSGLIGIGGGIFLAPVLYFFKWAKPKQIAAVTTFFIFVNSISGLAGQLQKHIDIWFLKDFIPLFVFVLIGGQIGGFLCSVKLSQVAVKRVTACLILLASFRVIIKVFANV